MASIRIPYLVTKPGRRLPDGTRGRRHFWQPSAALRAQGWQPVRLSDDPLAAQREAQNWNERLRQWRERGEQAAAVEAVAKPTGKTLGELITAYKQSRYYARLADSTKKKQYDPALELLRAWAGDDPVAELEADDVEQLIDPLFQATPAKARAVAAVLSVLLTYGQRTIKLQRNVAVGLASEYRAPKGLIWPRQAVLDFAATADALEIWSVADAVLLNEWCGQRKEDLLGLGRNLLSPEGLVVNQRKGARYDAYGYLEVHRVPHLVTRFKAAFQRQQAAGHTATTAIVHEGTGQPYTLAQFRVAFEQVRTALDERQATWPGDPGLIDRQVIRAGQLQFSALRHTAVTRLAEAGVDALAIAAITGHSPRHCLDIINRYLVRTRALGAAAFSRRLEAERE